MKAKAKTVVVLFDHSVGQLRMDGNRVSGIDLWPSIQVYLDSFTKQGCVVILAIPQKISADDIAALQGQMAPMALVTGTTIAGIVKQKRLREASRPLLFVSIDRHSRRLAREHLKAEVVPHIQAAAWGLEGEEVFFGRILTNRRPDIKTTGILPYHIEKCDFGWLVLGLIKESELPRLLIHGAQIHLLPFDFRVKDCCLIRIDDACSAGSKPWQGGDLLIMEQGRLLVAFAENDPDPELTRASAHGCLEMLLPSPELLENAGDPQSFTIKAVNLAALMKEEQPGLIEEHPQARIMDDRLLALPDADAFLDDARRYSGLSPLDAAGPVVSRHIYHPDNARVVKALTEDLRDLGLCVFTHSFIYNGRALKNVIADLPGTGRLRIKPEILEKIVKILERHPRPWPWTKIEKELKRELGPTAFKALEKKSDGPLRFKLEDMIAVYPWLPWWKLKRCLPGYGAQVVILGCHLDSSGSNTPGGYNPATDPAPGMDDNASGMAAVLAAARYMVAYRGELTHTVRFCFFNGEEAGLLGSKAYAAALKSMKTPVRAVICTDMLGYNSDANRIFEIHAGYSDPLIRDKSLPIASSVAAWAACLGALQPAQIYQGTSVSAGAPDRNLFDPAINRSDHAAFHQQGYGAVVVSEDFFTNLASEPAKDPNPNYHTAADTVIDPGYGVSIAGAVACSVKAFAR